MPLFSLITPFITPKKEDNILLISILICQTTTIFFYKNQRAKKKRRALTYHKSESACTDCRPNDSRYHQHTTICARSLKLDHDQEKLLERRKRKRSSYSQFSTNWILSSKHIFLLLMKNWYHVWLKTRFS